MKSSPPGIEPPIEGVVREACIFCLRFVALRFVVAAAAVVPAGGVRPIARAQKNSCGCLENMKCLCFACTAVVNMCD